MGVTISKSQKDYYVEKGKKLIKDRAISGFQLEDFNPKTVNKKQIIYAHNNPKHLKKVVYEINGKLYPRESYYKWEKEWKKTNPNTVLLFNKTLAKDKETYIISVNPKIDQSLDFFKNRTIRQRSSKPMQFSWFVPDIRLYNIKEDKPEFKKAWLFTKKIDKDSRFATIVTKKKRLEELKKKFKREKVRKIQIQDYRPKKKHSLWDFIDRYS